MAKLVDQLKVWVELAGSTFPWAIFLAIVILPAFGFPVSLLLVIAGVVWGASVPSCLLALLAIGLNIAGSHFATRGLARPILSRILGSRWKQWSELPATGHLRLTVILRVTPGIPLCVQNYLLSLTGVSLGVSLAVALPVTGLYVFGFVLTGGAIFEGRGGLLIASVSFLVVAGAVMRGVRRRFTVTPADSA